jgi:hypothetical protein
MNRKRAYLDGDYTQQTLALDDILQALEGNFVHFSLWNYTADNEHVHGDQWNEEDLSIFCADPQAGEAGLNDGGRALEAVIRPYAMRIPGTPLHQSFDPQQKSYSFSFKPDLAIQAPLVIFVPAYHYPRGVVLEGANGKVDYIPENQRLKYWPSPSEDNPVHSLVLVQSQKKPEI